MSEYASLSDLPRGSRIAAENALVSVYDTLSNVPYPVLLTVVTVTSQSYNAGQVSVERVDTGEMEEARTRAQAENVILVLGV